MMQLTIITCLCSQWTNNRLSTESILSQAQRPSCSTSDRIYRLIRGFSYWNHRKDLGHWWHFWPRKWLVSLESQDVGRGVSACNVAVQLIAMLCLISSSEHATKSSTSVLCKCTSCVVGPTTIFFLKYCTSNRLPLLRSIYYPVPAVLAREVYPYLGITAFPPHYRSNYHGNRSFHMAVLSKVDDFVTF